MGDGQSRFREIHFLFPEGKDKALTFSYDDAQVYDREGVLSGGGRADIIRVVCLWK